MPPHRQGHTTALIRPKLFILQEYLMETSKQKPLSLPEYDYSKNGAYFVTISAHRREMLYDKAGTNSICAQMIEDCWGHIMGEHKNIQCPKYVIMPNHFHAIIIVPQSDADPDTALSAIVQSFKEYSTAKYSNAAGQNLQGALSAQIWQRSFYKHIIKSDNEYKQIWHYIDSNPALWSSDEDFIKKD